MVGGAVVVSLPIWDVAANIDEDMVVSTEFAVLFVVGELEETSSELVVDVEMVLVSELVEIISPSVDLLVVVLAVGVVWLLSSDTLLVCGLVTFAAMVVMGITLSEEVSTESWTVA